MFVISVSPITKDVRSESLSYWHKEAISPGKIVTVPIRNKFVKGLIIECKEATSLKTEIRQSDFIMKKIKSVSKNGLFLEPFVNACGSTAKYFASSTGSILNSITPKAVFEDIGKLNSKLENSSTLPKESGKFIIQSSDGERYQDYKSVIRGRFAKKGSVFFCVPTIEDAETAYDRLSKGIENSTICIHGRLNKTELTKRWNDIIQSEKPVLIISTGSFFGIPRSDIRTIIVESENSPVYKTQQRPYFDIRKFAEFFAAEIGAQLFFGDLMLRSETLKRYDEHEFFEFSPIKFRFVTTASQKLIDMKKETAPNSSDFSFLSKDLWRMIMDGREQSKKTLLLVSRRGLATNIVCGDCGHTVMCENCSSPMTLHDTKSIKNKKYNSLRCKKCGFTKEAEIKCEKCGGWRLVALGIGTETIAKEIKEKLGEKEIFILDKDHTKTSLQAKKIVNQFYDSPAPIIVATEMALLYLHDEIDNVGVVSIDAMFSLPDYQIKERIMNIVMQAKDLARENFIIQTRYANEDIFSQITEGNLMDFYRKEFIERKRFNYPPFSLLIKIRASNKSLDKLESDFKNLEEYFKPEEFFYYPNFTEKIKGLYIMNGLLKIDKQRWPDDLIIQKLKGLPPNYSVIVDALSVL